jgi:hypothetical protein
VWLRKKVAVHSSCIQVDEQTESLKCRAGSSHMAEWPRIRVHPYSMMCNGFDVTALTLEARWRENNVQKPHQDLTHGLDR